MVAKEQEKRKIESVSGAAESRNASGQHKWLVLHGMVVIIFYPHWHHAPFLFSPYNLCNKYISPTDRGKEKEESGGRRRRFF